MFTIWLTPGFQVGDIVVIGVEQDLLRVEHTDLLVPRSLTARFDRPGMPFVELDIRYDQHERFRCDRVQVTARDDESISTAAVRLPLEALLYEALERVAYREIALADEEMVAVARTQFREKTEAWEDGDTVDTARIQVGDIFRFPVAVMLFEFARSEYEQAFGTRVRKILRDADHSRAGAVSHLAVSLEYQRAMAAGEETGFAVAERFGWKRQYANNRIAAARKAGYLPPAEPGQPSTWGTSEA